MPVSIEQLGADELDSLGPLWLSLLEHHGRVSPPVLRMVGPADSWERRRRVYREWLEVPGASRWRRAWTGGSWDTRW